MILKIFNYLNKHHNLRWGILLTVTLSLFLMVFRLSYKEDISDFLPLGTEDRDALDIYQEISGTDRIFVLFENPGDEDMTAGAVDRFSELFSVMDTMGWVDDLTSQFDLETLNGISDFVYDNIPYFLTDDDYSRIDSLIHSENFVGGRLKEDREALLFPTGGLVSRNIAKDPLNLFSPVLSRLQKSNEQLAYEMYDGKIFTPGMKYAVAMMTTPFGSSETEMNGALIGLIDDVAAQVTAEFPEISIHSAGGPKIAVGNSARIKKDSAIAVTLAIILILSLLIYAFRSKKNMLLIVVSIVWGWIFAMGAISLFRDSVSIIVIGISSVILGIAVNYPLHLIDHMRHEPDIRGVLKDIVAPLVIGNITTVGAFMALVPLQSTALRDLGLFASLLLIGTIVFVMVFLPHMVRKTNDGIKEPENKAITYLSKLQPEKSRTFVVTIVILTLVFGWMSFDTEFDSNIANINYMDDVIREDMQYFQSLVAIDTTSNTRTLYVVSSDTTMDLALQKSEKRRQMLDSVSHLSYVTASEGVGNFICSTNEQARRIEKWNRFVSSYGDSLLTEIIDKAPASGFRPEAFGQFTSCLQKEFGTVPVEHFKPLSGTVFHDNLSRNVAQKRYSVVDKLQVEEGMIDSLRSAIPGSFDVKSMNSAMADSLSDDFNYIGWACSFIVFFFLWFSFGNLELAALSFLPMAVSWLWILGIMALLGIKFNIVNVILATFIFGQGDDYTIFITEGCCHEYAYRRPILQSYKRSIILSAMIMFVGIGTLIVAEHPALKSLAEVTIIGMFSVVLMAYVLPPLIFRWVVSTHGNYRIRPLKISSLMRTIIGGSWWFIQVFFTHAVAWIRFFFGKRRKWTMGMLHRFLTSYYRIDLKLLPGVKIEIRNPYGEDFSKPAIVIANHQSMLDPMFLMAVSRKILIVANQHSSYNPIIKRLFKRLDFYTLKGTLDEDMHIFKDHIEKGYSIAIFPEGLRNPKRNIERFHKGAFYMAHTLGVDIVPIFLHGVNDIMPIHSFACESGKLTICIEKRVETAKLPWGDNSRETTKYFHKYFIKRFAELRAEIETADYHAGFVYDRYLYKGVEIQKTVRHNLRHYGNYRKWIDSTEISKDVVVINNGYGEFSLLMALVHPDVKITAAEIDPMKRIVAEYSKEGIVDNLSILEAPEDLQGKTIFLLSPSKSDLDTYGNFSPIVVE